MHRVEVIIHLVNLCMHICVYRNPYMHLFITSNYLSISLHAYLSIHLSPYLSIDFSPYLPISLTIYLFIYLSIQFSTYSSHNTSIYRHYLQTQPSFYQYIYKIFSFTAARLCSQVFFHSSIRSIQASLSSLTHSLTSSPISRFFVLLQESANTFMSLPSLCSASTYFHFST